MARFKHIFFVCTHRRAEDHPQGSCAQRGSEALLEQLKTCVKRHQLQGRVRVVRSGCLDCCVKGCAVAVFSAEGPAPETWYTRLKPADAIELFERHVLEQKTWVCLPKPSRGTNGQF